MKPLNYKSAFSIQGPIDQIYRFLTLDKHAKVDRLTRVLSPTGEDNGSTYVHLTLSFTQAIKLLTHYKLDYKVLALDGYPTSCPLVSAALSGYKKETEVSDDQS